MKKSWSFILAGVVVLAGLWLSLGPSSSAGTGIVAPLAWSAPPSTWSNNITYSAQHNATMAHLWNEVRLKERWDSADAEFIVNCLADPPTFTGADWEQADLEQNESACRYMNAASIFAEHLQIGGKIDGPSVGVMKSVLVEGLGNQVATVRGYSATALIMANFLGDSSLRTRIEGMKADKHAYVRSVVKTQLENLRNQQKDTHHSSPR